MTAVRTTTPAVLSADAIVEQVMVAIERQRQARGLTYDTLAANGHICQRTARYAGKLQRRLTLRTLIGLAASVGLHLDIRIRTTPTSTQPGDASHD